MVQAILKLPCANGWMTKNLPAGWLVKGTRAGYSIIGPDGSFFESKVKAIDHMRVLGSSLEDKLMLEQFSKHDKSTKENMGEIRGKKPQSQSKQWVKTDSCLPWRQDLQKLLKSGGSKTDIAPLRGSLIARGWRMKGLPAGWMGKSLPNFEYRLSWSFCSLSKFPSYSLS